MLVLGRVTRGVVGYVQEGEESGSPLQNGKQDKKNLWTSKERRGVERVKWASCERDGEI